MLSVPTTVVGVELRLVLPCSTYVKESEKGSANVPVIETLVVPGVITKFGCEPCTVALTLVTAHTLGLDTLHEALTEVFIVKFGRVISGNPVTTSGDIDTLTSVLLLEAYLGTL